MAWMYFETLGRSENHCETEYDAQELGLWVTVQGQINP